MKVSTQNPELYRALRKVMEKVPALVADPRTITLEEVVSRLAAQGMPEAQLVQKAETGEVAALRAALIRDVFSKQGSASTERITGERPAQPREKPLALVSGGSYSGMLAAIALAKSGNQVTLVEARPQHSRDIRLVVRQGMLDSLAAVDPELATRVMERASTLSPGNMKLVSVAADGRESLKPLPNYGTELAREPDGAKAPATGTELMESAYTHVIVARELEEVVEAYAKEKFPSTITFIEGKVHAEKTEQGLAFTLDKTGRDGKPVYEELLGGKSPKLVIVAEGASSSTRAALDIPSAETTPVQYWTAGVAKTIDKDAAPGEASLRVMSRQNEVVDPTTGAKTIVATRAVAISDGKEGTWLLTEMPPFYNPNPALAQEAINAHYLDVGSLVTGHSREELEAAGIAGPIKRDGSVPAAFGLQGKTAKEAARVTGDGTVVAFVGDSTVTSSFQAGGGMNTAISEVQNVLTLAADLQSGVPPDEAAKRFEQSVFQRGDAWAAAGIPFFYARTTVEKTKALMAKHLQAIADWRREGGPTPLKRLEAMLQGVSVATEPIGPKLAA